MTKREVKPEVLKAMAKIHKDALKAQGNAPRPAVLCTCGHTLEQHTDEHGAVGGCRLCIDSTMMLNGKPIFSKCPAWNPERVTVKDVRRQQRKEA